VLTRVSLSGYIHKTKIFPPPSFHF